MTSTSISAENVSNQDRVREFNEPLAICEFRHLIEWHRRRYSKHRGFSYSWVCYIIFYLCAIEHVEKFQHLTMLSMSNSDVVASAEDVWFIHRDQGKA